MALDNVSAFAMPVIDVTDGVDVSATNALAHVRLKSVHHT